MNVNAEYWIKKFDLKPHVEGGWFKQTWLSDVVIPQTALVPAYSGERPACSHIYYLLQKGEKSAWHKLKSTEIWLWHSGGILEQKLGGTGGSPVEKSCRYLGKPSVDLDSNFEAIVPADNWQTARLIQGNYALVSCIVAPAYSQSDFTPYLA